MGFDFKDKVVVIHGACCSLGLGLASKILSSGAKSLIALDYSFKGLEYFDDLVQKNSSVGKITENPVTLVPFDGSDLQGMRRLAKNINDKWSKVDLVVSLSRFNMPLIPLSDVDPQFAANCFVFNTNFVFGFLQAMDALIRDSKCRLLFSANINNCPEKYQSIFKASQIAAQSCVFSYAQEVFYTGCKAATFELANCFTAMSSAEHADLESFLNSTDSQHMVDKLFNVILEDVWLPGKHIDFT